MRTPTALPPATFQRAIENADDGIYITDPRGTILFANRAILEITGYREEEFVGKTTSIFNSGEMPDRYYKRLWNTVLAGSVWRELIVNRRADGSLYEASQTITPVLNERGEIDVLVAVQRDLSRQRELEAELHRSQTEIESLLVEKEALIGEVYHRTKNDLLLFQSLLTVQASEQDSSVARAALESAAGRAGALGRVYALLQSQAGSGSSRIPLEMLLAELVDGIRQGPLPTGSDIDLHSDSVAVPARVATSLCIAVYELVLNAVKHARTDGAALRLVVRAVVPEPGRLELTVADNGPGLPASILEQGGFGGGLRILSLLAEQFHGRLILRNESGAVVGIVIRITR